MKIKKNKKIENLLKRLVKSQFREFPKRGYAESIGVPIEQGVYIIYDYESAVVHVGRTQRGNKGLRQRLNNHLLGQSSFVKRYLKGKGNKLRGSYRFKYLVISDSRERALVEALAIGKLCPSHLGLGDRVWRR
ncbi:GIY-YIG nuclease family protein [Patescibacteria group bacterium]|nr:GIY-YIG nuclease family protein [Patescibacteria group bacterium]